MSKKNKMSLTAKITLVSVLVGIGVGMGKMYESFFKNGTQNAPVQVNSTVETNGPMSPVIVNSGAGNVNFQAPKPSEK